MAHSRAMPNAPSTAVRLRVPLAVSDRIEDVARSLHLPRDEIVELVMRSRLDGPDSPAARLWEQYAAGVSQTPAEVKAKLKAAGFGNERVRALRIGSPAPDREPVPWPRPGTGAELSWSAVEVWPIVRGLWRMNSTGVAVIVALRLGYTLGVYRVGGWAEHMASGRKYALNATIVTPAGRLQDAETSADVGPASEAHLALLNVVSAAPIVATGQQPVVMLSDH